MNNVSEGTRTELTDAPRCGRPRTSRTAEMIEVVRQMIEEDPHLSSRDLAEQLDCEQKTVLSILKEDL